MDKVIYLAAQAAKSLMARQDNVASNLANVSTPGFRAQMMALRSAPIQGPGLGVREFAAETVTGFNAGAGAINNTGRDLDVAVEGDGWLSVEGANGREAYTRSGSLQVNADGELVNSAGRAVLSDAGARIEVPAAHRVQIEGDGSVTALPLDPKNKAVQNLGRIKLVDPPSNTLVRGDDGLFRLRNGQPADRSERVRVTSGALETSNVNAAETMVQMISAAKQFEANLKVITTAEQNAQTARSLFTLN
jgi:flagellar basal-body rod protein FlgF